MNEAGFRAWLSANYSPNTVQTKLSEARQLAKSYGDLDRLYDEDGLDSVMEGLRYSAADRAQKRPNPSKVPLASDLYRDLSNLRTTVNYYRKFRGEKARPKPDVPAVNQAIDECIAVELEIFLATYGFAKDIEYWVVRDGGRYPSKAVYGVAHQFMPGGAPLDSKNCDGTTARLHLEKLGFEIVKGGATPIKANDRPFLLFDAAGAAFKPVRNGERDGRSVFKIKPLGASNRTDEAIKVETIAEVAKAMLVDGLPARVQSVGGGQVNYIGYGKQKLVRYELDPAIARQIGVPPKGTVGDPLANEPETKVARQQEDSEMPNPTNLILFGPPGTGKTYATADEAVRLCDGDAAADRAELMGRYRQLVDAGQVRFVTFHQSYAYEDFVEGLRPVTGGDGAEQADGEGGPSVEAGFRLEAKRGVFREICALAEQARKSGRGGGNFNLAGRRFFKMSLGRAGIQDHIFDAAIEGGYVVLGWGREVDWSDRHYDDWGAILQRWQQEDPKATGNDPNVTQMWSFRSAMREGDIVIVSEGNSSFRAIGEVVGPYRYDPIGTPDYNHRRPVRWLLVPDESLPVEIIYSKKFMMQSCYQLKDARVNKEGLLRLLPGASGAQAGSTDQFVLVIDEINRANISKVFGELITLIEPDKRLGAENGLTVQLPYSGDMFGVPANLHIVGTMNTADRSIALLDTALRRRFDFRELMPDPGLLEENIDGVPLRAMLQTLNERIEYLFDREHQIGHAFFINCASRGDIDRAMRNKVIPLLQEYFYEDWEKVASVLGDADAPAGEGAFIVREKLLPPKRADQDGESVESRWRWHIRQPFNDDAYDRFR